MSYIFPGAIPYNAQATGITPTRTAMWIKTEGQHPSYADASKFERLYISYKGNGNYAIVGVIGDRDIAIRACSNAKEAVDVLDDLVRGLGML